MDYLIRDSFCDNNDRPTREQVRGGNLLCNSLSFFSIQRKYCSRVYFFWQWTVASARERARKVSAAVKEIQRLAIKKINLVITSSGSRRIYNLHDKKLINWEKKRLRSAETMKINFLGHRVERPWQLATIAVGNTRNLFLSIFFILSPLGTRKWKFKILFEEEEKAQFFSSQCHEHERESFTKLFIKHNFCMAHKWGNLKERAQMLW